MKPDKAVREKDNLKASIRLLKFFVILIGVAIFYLGYKVDRAVKYQRTILVPGLDHKIEVTGDDLSDDSIDFYARHIVLLRANFSPGTVRKNFVQLLKLFAPESYPDAWKLYYDFADKIEATNVTSVYFIQDVKANKKDRQIIVYGQNRQFKNNTQLSEAMVQFTLSYKIDSGMFKLLNLDEKEKSR